MFINISLCDYLCYEVMPKRKKKILLLNGTESIEQADQKNYLSFSVIIVVSLFIRPVFLLVLLVLLAMLLTTHHYKFDRSLKSK